MSSLLSLGISPSDSKMLMEYEEVSWFIEDAQRQKSNSEIKQILDNAEMFRMAQIGLTKKGLVHYNKWRDTLLDQFKKRPEDIPQETLFEQIKKKSKVSEPKTLFEQIKKKIRGK